MVEWNLNTEIYVSHHIPLEWMIKINQTAKEAGHHVVIFKSRDKVESGKMILNRFNQLLFLHMKIGIEKRQWPHQILENFH